MSDHREHLLALADGLPADAGVTIPVAWLREILDGEPAQAPLEPDAPDLTAAQVAARFGRDASTVRGWIARGELTGAYRFQGWELRVPAADVLAFEARQRLAARTPTPRRSGKGRQKAADLTAWRKMA